MTREQIILELQLRATQKYLIYLALQEIMLENYEDVNFLKAYDNDLKNKHLNIINSLKKKSTEAYRFLQSHEQGEATIKQFYEFVTLFEKLHLAIDKGGAVFHDCINAVELILNQDETKESN
jgi:hypothetical protein